MRGRRDVQMKVLDREERMTYAATAQPKAACVWLLYGPAFVAYTVAALLGDRVGRSSEVVGGSGLGVDGGHLDEQIDLEE